MLIMKLLWMEQILGSTNRILPQVVQPNSLTCLPRLLYLASSFELLGSSFFLKWKERHQVCAVSNPSLLCDKFCPYLFSIFWSIFVNLIFSYLFQICFRAAIFNIKFTFIQVQTHLYFYSIGSTNCLFDSSWTSYMTTACHDSD